MFENEDRNATPAARKEVQGTTANPGAKFAIGMLAGIAAVLLPRLLAKSDDAHIVFFPSSYFLLAAGVGVFLGLVMLVLEYQVPTRPKETFMAALGAGHPQGRRLQPPGGGSAPAGQTRGRHLFAADPVRQQCVCARQQLRARGVRFGVRVEQPRYVVVLKKSGSAEQAVQDAQRLRVNIPGARAVRSDKGYFVVLGSAPAGETLK